MNTWLIPITNDLFHIAEALTQIDSRYRIYFNKRSGKYQLHTDSKRDNYLLTFPFARLDARCIEHTHKSKRERAKAILAQLDAAEQSARVAALNAAKSRLSEAVERRGL